MAVMYDIGETYETLVINHLAAFAAHAAVAKELSTDGKPPVFEIVFNPETDPTIPRLVGRALAERSVDATIETVGDTDMFPHVVALRCRFPAGKPFPNSRGVTAVLTTFSVELVAVALYASVGEVARIDPARRAPGIVAGTLQ